MGRRAYDFLYRRGAPWEIGARSELVALVESGRLAPGRALDVGCGSGANSIYLAGHGFDVTGVDFSTVALAKGEAAARAAGVDVQWVAADLTTPTVSGVDGEFDVVVDYGTLDDFRSGPRALLADHLRRWTRPGGVLLVWCFYDEIGWWRRKGARFPGIKDGEVDRLFGGDFTLERLPEPAPGSGFAMFWLARRPAR